MLSIHVLMKYLSKSQRLALPPTLAAVDRDGATAAAAGDFGQLLAKYSNGSAESSLYFFDGGIVVQQDHAWLRVALRDIADIESQSVGDVRDAGGLYLIMRDGERFFLPVDGGVDPFRDVWSAMTMLLGATRKYRTGS